MDGNTPTTLLLLLISQLILSRTFVEEIRRLSISGKLKNFN